MKRTHLLPLLAAGCLVWGCSDAPEMSTAGWQTMNNRDGFSIQVPPGWKAFNLEKMSDLDAAKAYAKDKPDLKKIVDQIVSVEQGRMVALDPTTGMGMNVTRTNNQFHDLTIDQLKDRLVEATKDTYPWVGLPEAGIADFPAGKAVMIRGLLPQQIGENQLIEQYSFPSKDFLFTVSFICLKSRQGEVSKYFRPVTATFAIKK